MPRNKNGAFYAESVPTQGPPKMTKTNIAAPAEPPTDPKAQAMWAALGEQGAAKLGAALGELEKLLEDRGMDVPADAVSMVKLASEYAAEQKAARLAGQRIPAGARSPLRRHGLSAREQKMLTAQKVDPAKYTKVRAAMKARSPRGAK